MKEQKKKQRVAAKEQKKIEKPVDQGDTSTAQPGSKQNSSGKWSEAVTGAHSYQDRSRKRKVRVCLSRCLSVSLRSTACGIRSPFVPCGM